jgi:acyl-coenzyme A synthetase/AMP-(fatty) acid ligase
MTINKAMVWFIGRMDDNIKVSGKMVNSTAKENTVINQVYGETANGTMGRKCVGFEDDH